MRDVFKITIMGKAYEIIAKPSAVVAMEDAIGKPIDLIPNIFLIGKVGDQARVIAAALRANGHKLGEDVEEAIVEQLMIDKNEETEEGLRWVFREKYIVEGFFGRLKDISRKKLEAAEAEEAATS